MSGSSRLLAGSLVMSLCAAGLFASPVADGVIGPGEYPSPIIDDAEPSADFYNTGLDIDRLYHQPFNGSSYLGLSVVNPPFDTDGSALSFVGMTGVGMYFYPSESSMLPDVIVSLAFNAFGLVDDLSFIRERQGLSWVETDFDELTPGPAGDYEIGLASAMELRLAKSALKLYQTGFPQFLRLQLDDTGGQQDDQIAGALPVPEPAVLALLALGAPWALRRRRH